MLTRIFMGSSIEEIEKSIRDFTDKLDYRNSIQHIALSTPIDGDGKLFFIILIMTKL